MACATLNNFLIFLRNYWEWFIDFIFSLVWENTHKPIPRLQKKHAMLAESAVSLARKIRMKQLKSEDLVRAVIERIKEVNPILNALVDERFEDALNEARAIDRDIEAGQTDAYFEKRPFLGVPFTCKESHAVAGMRHTLGVPARRHARAHEDAECVRLLRAAGALPIAVTNVPEINKWQETRNNLFGMTLNPFHTGRSVGGSSGGEAALMAAIATPISLCSDIGGSTRMPAFYCGLFGHNPTAGNTSLKGSALRSGAEDATTMASVGFMARHCGDLAPLTRVVAPQLNLDRHIDVTKLKVFYVEAGHDPLISPIRPELRAAMRKVTEHFSSIASEPLLAPTTMPHNGFGSMFRLWKYHMAKENEDFALMLTNNQYRANGLVELGKKLIGRSEFTLAAILKMLDDMLMPKEDEAWAEWLTNAMRSDIGRLLGDNGVLLFPSCSQPAPYHYSAFLRPYNFAYWGLINVLRMPATQVPLGLSAAGLPLGLQVVSGPKNDALCLAVARHIERVFGGFVAPCVIES